MTEDMMAGFEKVLKELGYKDVHDCCGVVYYKEIDGTAHYLMEADCK